MKRTLLFFIPLLLLFSNAKSQGTTLSPGDLSIIGFNSDLNNRDGHAFVCWIPIASGTVISFTDNGFTTSSASTTIGKYRNGETTLSWTATSALPAGTVVTIEGKGVSPNVISSTGTSSVVSSSGSPIASLDLGVAGDEIFAFQGPFPTVQSMTATFTGTLLYGVRWQGVGSFEDWITSGTGGSNSSYLPSEITNYALSFAGNALAAEYTGSRTGLTVAQFKATVNNSANWKIYSPGNNTGVNSYNTTNFSIAPSITTQPSNQTICAGNNTSFTVIASNATSYQWQVSTNGGSNFDNLSDAAPYSDVTTATLSIAGATEVMNGYQYRCIATGSTSADATSNAATLAVDISPGIVTQPVSSAITEGANTSFSVTATNAMSYLWQVNKSTGFTNITDGGVYSGAGTASLSITGATAGMNGYVYRVLALSSCFPTATSSIATLNVNAALEIAPATLPSPEIGQAYSAVTFATTGGSLPYTYTVTSGSLPTGMTLTSAGVLSGTASQAGPGNFTVTSTDANSASVSKNYTWSITAPLMSVSPAILPIGTAGVPYSGTITASGGTTPYTFTISTGTLPSGLTLGTNGTLSGTPTQSGMFSIRVTVTDSSTGDSAPFSTTRLYPSFTINPASITSGGTINEMTTTYGTASAAQSFTVSGNGLSDNLVITPADAGFEVSKDNGIIYTSTTSLTPVSGVVSGTQILVRLSATAAAGSHSGNLVFSSTNLTDVNRAVPVSTVLAAPLTITVNNQSKVYGAGLPLFTASYAGFVNGDTQLSLTTLPTLNTVATASSSVAGSPYAVTASGALSSNYTISYAPGTLAVLAVHLTITATNRSKVYGATLPALTASYVGFVNGETPSSLTTRPTLSTLATASSSVAGSPYAITVTGALSSNYTITYAPGTLTVNAATLTIAATNRSKIYGAALPLFSASYAGFVNGDTPLSLTTLPTLSTLATASSSVIGSPYTITATGAVNPNYTITYASGALTVDAATLTIVANNQSKVYGAALPALTASYAGFVNGDTQASLITAPTLSTFATASSSVAGSPYAITVTGAVNPNYTITYASGALTVDAATLTIAANNQSKVYGAALPLFSASYVGFVNGDTPLSLITAPTLSTLATASSSVAGSPYTITATGAVNPNYTITYASGALTVDATTLTIAANNQSKVYGAALPALTASYAGFVNGDTPLSLITAPTLSTLATASSAVIGSPYAITATGAVNPNYTITYAPGTLTVDAATLTIAANNQSKIYGAALPTLTASYVGFVNGDTPLSLTTLPTLSTLAAASSSVAGSPYTITTTGAVNPNYTITYASGALTVDAATLTIAANNQNKVYGAALPALTASYAGFVNGDTQASLITAPTLSTIATASSSVIGSPYTITATGAVNPNYTITYASGALTVDAATLMIAANNQSKVYGAALPLFSASYVGFVNGDTQASLITAPTLSTIATASSSVIGSPYTITATGAVNPNYTITYASGALTVDAATLMIAANNQSKVYGAALPLFSASYVGFVNGDTPLSLITLPTLSTIATASSSVAGSPYAITATGAVNPNYTITYAPGTLTVDAATLTIAANNQSKVYGAALPALTASYAGFVNGDTQASLITEPTLSTIATASSSVIGSPYTITATGAVNPNYTITYASGALTVDAATLTIAANNQSKVYGAALPLFSASYVGFVNGDTPLSLTTLPTLSTLATASSSVAGSPYVITATGAVNPNYTITYAPGTLTVDAATLTIAANNQSKVYGAALPTLTASYAGFVNGDTQASLITAPTLSTLATASSSVAGSPYAITATGAVNPNYTITYASGTLTVDAATLTIAANNQSKIYGAALPLFTASYAGFVNGDTQASLITEPTLSTIATASSSVIGSPYTITATGAVNPNYTITYASGALTVDAATLTIAANNQSKVYGAALPLFSASYVGFVNGDTPLSLTTLPTLSTLATASSSVAGSPYAITATGAVNPNYTITYAPGTLTVDAATLTIAANNQSKVYGAALPALTASYAGFVNGDTPLSLTTLPTLSTLATASSSVAGSPYVITATGAVNPNYTITYASGTLTVDAATLTIAANNHSKIYGAALPALTASYAGFVNGDTQASLTTLPTLSTLATASSSVAGSPYVITATGAVNPNYTITYAPGTLTVDAATLTIAANNQSKVYGAALPLFTASYTGFVNGDTPLSLTTLPTLSTLATASSSVIGSPYVITATGGLSSNYTITYAPGTLTVDAATLTIAANNQSKIYGAALPALTASYVGFVNGDTQASLITLPTLSTLATASSSVAGSPYVITATGAVNPNYTITYAPGTLTVDAATLTIAANNQSKVYGAALPLFTASYTGFVNGDTQASLIKAPTMSTIATASSSVIGSPYTITATGAVNPNYTITYAPGTLTVDAATLTIAANNQSKIYGAALPALTASYAGFVNGDTQASLITAPTLSTIATASSSVAGNPYAITASGAVNPNYTITYIKGVLTVTAATLTITANNQTKVYGQSNPGLTLSYSGFVNRESPANFTTAPIVTTIATSGSAVSTYLITTSAAVISNYTLVYEPGTLSITPAALTITADDKNRNFGVSNPVFTLSYSGFVNNDDASKLINLPIAVTTASATAIPGSYPITVSGASSGNYSFNYVNGTLIVKQLNAVTVTGISISSGVLSPLYIATTHDYKVSLGNNTASVKFTVDFDPTATAKINGIIIPNGTASSEINLVQGNNVINLVVTAQDGVTNVTYTIMVYRGKPAINITATNLLTPNGDGKNDTWEIQDIRLYPNNSVVIYDRSGRQVYAKRGYDNTWDGTFQGAPLAEGTYFYTIGLGNGEPRFRGFISLLRSK